MKPPCELIANEILPAARSLTARKLIEEYGLSQRKAADLMGLSQPAVSQYRRNRRGHRTGIFARNPEILKMVNDLVKKIASGTPVEEQTVEFREICRAILRKGLICDLHKQGDPSLENCTICLDGRFDV